jgi:hypothetical protein
MVKIVRFWISERTEPDSKLLYKRPRIDFKISEYVFDHINKNILKPKNIMQTGDYEITLFFLIFNIWGYSGYKKHIQNIFDTENTIYDLEYGPNYSKSGADNYRDIKIKIYSNEFHENITPKKYANIVYDGIGMFLTNKYKKINKEIMDKNKNGMDYNYIESFNYPAAYEDQKYIGDGKDETKEKYKKYYNE